MMPAQMMAQGRVIKPKKIEQKPDSIPFFRGVAVSFDLVGPIMRMVGDYGQYEGALRVNLKDRIFPTLEIGYGKGRHDEDPITQLGAETSAMFGRIGCDFNIARAKHDDYRVLVGARYGYTAFDMTAFGNIKDPLTKRYVNYDYHQEGCKFHWFEALFALDARMWGPLRLGWSVRYRHRIYEKSADIGSIWYVPGYGSVGNSSFGGTFNVTYELTWKKKDKKPTQKREVRRNER
jgi:hypothetical protein